MSANRDPKSLALLSLVGLSVGDAFGEQFFAADAAQRIAARQLPPGPWPWTDDTHMALSIVETLIARGHINQDDLAQRFAQRYMDDPHRGYGGGASRLLRQIHQGADWHQAARALFGGGSFGNGGAMRAAPIGGFFAGDPARAADEARLSAEVTHAHPEGQAGAMAVAAAAAIAAQPGRLTGVDFLQAVLAYLPAGETRQGVQRAIDLPPNDPPRAARLLGAGERVSAQDTVPFCLWCAAHHLDDYSEALWATVSGLGDRDTTCAIVGGIVSLSVGSVPEAWLNRREEILMRDA